MSNGADCTLSVRSGSARSKAVDSATVDPRLRVRRGRIRALGDVFRRASARRTGRSSHGDWLTNCCKHCSSPSGSRSHRVDRLTLSIQHQPAQVHLPPNGADPCAHLERWSPPDCPRSSARSQGPRSALATAGRSRPPCRCSPSPLPAVCPVRARGARPVRGGGAGRRPRRHGMP